MGYAAQTVLVQTSPSGSDITTVVAVGVVVQVLANHIPTPVQPQLCVVKFW